MSIARNEQQPVDELQIGTVRNEQFVFKCFDAAEVAALVQHIVQTMRKNSVYAVAVQVGMCGYLKSIDYNRFFLIIRNTRLTSSTYVIVK